MSLDFINPVFDKVGGAVGDVLGPLGGSPAKVPTRINSLIANIAGFKLSYPHKYEIGFNYFTDPMTTLRLCVSCESCVMPGKTISTQEIKYHGPNYEMPYEESYAGDMEVTFKLAGDMFERTVFEDWQNRVIDSTSHNLGYLKTYGADIEITQLDLKDNPIYRIVLEDAWPKTIGPIQLGDERVNEINKQTISFAYRKWRVKPPDEVGFLEGVLNRLDLVGRLDRWLQSSVGGDFPIPMIPTAIGGHVISLPWGLDPGQIEQQGQDILGNWFNEQLGDII